MLIWTMGNKLTSEEPNINAEIRPCQLLRPISHAYIICDFKSSDQVLNSCSIYSCLNVHAGPPIFSRPSDSHRCSVFSAHGKSLQRTQDGQEHRGRDANGAVAWDAADQHRGQCHEHNTGNEGQLTRVIISQMTEKDCTQRSDDKSHGEDPP